MIGQPHDASVQRLISDVEDLAKWTHTGKTSACLRMIVY